MEKELESRMIENALQQTADSAVIVGTAVGTVAKRMEKPGKVMLMHGVQKVRRKHGN